MSESLLGLQIDKQVIQNIVNNAVTTAIASALDSKNDVVAKIVKAALEVRVDKDGKVSCYSSENKYNIVESFVNKAIQEEAREAISEVINEKREEIRKILRKQFMATKTFNHFVDAFIESTKGALESEYYTTVSINMEKRREEY